MLCKGAVSAFQSMGAVDGPGIRTVVFMQGCPLRCVYCHNPETWSFKEGTTDVEELFKKILRYRPFFGKNGGITVSGGEPMCQQEFVTELFKLAKENGIHTCIDTSGQIPPTTDILKYTDLLLCDVKFLNEEDYDIYCKGSFKKLKHFLNICEEEGVEMWLRHVVVPGVTDNKDYIIKIRDFMRKYKNVSKTELLHFKNMCEEKYTELGIPFPLKNTKLLTENEMNELRALL